MKAKIVIGLQFGDEGKGITTDYLCCKHDRNKTVNIRFSGGQQAGHTVVKGDKEHVFASFGSGTLAGVPTYLTEHCTFYPPNLLNEYYILKMKNVNPDIAIHPRAMCTTPYDVAFGRWREKVLQHGSCGIGVGATMKRNLHSPYKFYATDLMYQPIMDEKFRAIKKYYENEMLKFCNNSPVKHTAFVKEFLDMVKPEMVDFLNSLESIVIQHTIRNNIQSYQALDRFDNLIFEGSQGIMLDQEHGIFPNVTYAHTTSKNAMEVCREMGIDRENIEIFYVTRCYQTRHGNGWMSKEWPCTNGKFEKLVNNEKETNVINEWQGFFRAGEIDYRLLNYAIKCDSYSWGCTKNLVVTCLDQRPDLKFDYSKLDYTPRWNRVYESRSREANFS